MRFAKQFADRAVMRSITPGKHSTGTVAAGLVPKAAKCAFAFALALLYAAAPVSAADFRSVTDATVLYDAPAIRGKKLYVAPRGMPLEVIVVNEAWVRVRDKSGELSWIERRFLSDKRTVIANAPTVVLREQASDSARAVITVTQHVVFDLIEAPSSGWAKVKHRDGATGFVAINQVWGL